MECFAEELINECLGRRPTAFENSLQTGERKCSGGQRCEGLYAHIGNLNEIKPFRSEVIIMGVENKQLFLEQLFDAHLGGSKGYRNGV